MPALSLEGQTLGKYRVLAPLGVGGMARVYRAYQPGLDRYVAIKVLRHELVEAPEFLARFKREAQAVAALRHPNIVQMFDFDAQADLYYMVMELLEGNTLKARLHEYRVRSQRMPLAEAVHCLSDGLAGLAYAHQAGLIHRDVKPANLMLTRHGQTVLTDFGIAQIVGSSPYTASGVLMGTLNYMAPEQGLQGLCDARSDLYSLGIVFYEMLTGRVPFEADTPLAVLMKHVNEPLPLPRTLNPGLPEAVERLLLKTLSKNPADRYQTASDMAQALQAALTEIQLSGVPMGVAGDALQPPPLGVFSGEARATLTETSFTQADTDVALAAKLVPALSASPTTPTVARGVGRAVLAGIGTLLAIILVSLTLAGATGQAITFMSVVWPIFVLWVACLLSLLMESLASILFIIPITLCLNIGVLLSYYTLSGNWRQWFFWPALSLCIFGEILLALYWARPAFRQRARQLGAVGVIVTASLMILQMLAATIATR